MNASDPRVLRGFLDLPPELRELVYGFVFADCHAATLRVYKLSHRPPWLVRYHSGITSPPLLRASWLIYAEARAVMSKILGAPAVVVEQIQHWEIDEQFGGHESCWSDGVPRDCVPEMRPLEEMTLMLLGVHALRLEISTARGFHPAERYAEEVRLHALLRWMSAVVAVRKSALRRLVIAVSLETRFATLHTTSEFSGILVGFRSRELTIELQRPGDDPLPSVSVNGDGQVVGEATGSWDEVERTWQALLESTAHWPRQQWSPRKYMHLLRERKWFELWQAFGELIRGEL